MADGILYLNRNVYYHKAVATPYAKKEVSQWQSDNVSSFSVTERA